VSRGEQEKTDKSFNNGEYKNLTPSKKVRIKESFKKDISKHQIIRSFFCLRSIPEKREKGFEKNLFFPVFRYKW
jgi:hypothetical protein